MKASNVIEIVRRGNFSRIAKQMEKFEFNNPVNEVTVAQNAPCSIQNDGKYPSQCGWKEFKGELEHIGNPYTAVDVWIKTATLGGRRRTWVRSAQ